MTAAAYPKIVSLSSPDRRALIGLLVSATAAPSRPDRSLRPPKAAVRDAPLRLLPETAEHHPLGGTVRRGLVGIDDLLDQVLIQLDCIRQASPLRHLARMGALCQVGREFDDAGLAWVVMNGPVLASHLYPDVGERSHGDLDLIVHGADFGVAMKLLENFGHQHDIHDCAG